MKKTLVFMVYNISALKRLNDDIPNLKLCLATATHNFKWLKITDNCSIWDQTFTNLDI